MKMDEIEYKEILKPSFLNNYKKVINNCDLRFFVNVWTKILPCTENKRCDKYWYLY